MKIEGCAKRSEVVMKPGKEVRQRVRPSIVSYTYDSNMTHLFPRVPFDSEVDIAGREGEEVNQVEDWLALRMRDSSGLRLRLDLEVYTGSSRR